MNVLLCTIVPFSTSGEIHRENSSDNCSSARSIEQKEDYMLSFVEFDEQGQIADPTQWKCLKKELQQKQEKGKGLLIIVFTHGWNHSAKSEDDNLVLFKATLKRIKQFELENLPYGKEREREVVGVYLGWRGESIAINGIKLATFWGRKGVAEEIGRSGAITEVLLELETIRNKYSERKNRLVVVGHSFGGLITYFALSNIFIERFISSRYTTCRSAKSGDEKLRQDSPTTCLKGFGDLVVLINPALEAMRFFSLYDLTQKYIHNIGGKQEPKQLPLMAILTSEADVATKWAFPAGRYLSLLMLQRFYKLLKRPYGKVEIEEEEAELTTIGHFNSYITHTLEGFENEDKFDPKKEHAIISELKRKWVTPDEPEDKREFEFPGTKLTSEGHYLNPYLVIKVKKNVISGHSMPRLYSPKSGRLSRLFSNNRKREAKQAIKLLQFMRYLIFLSDPPDQDAIVTSKNKDLEGLRYVGERNTNKALEALRESYNASPIHHKASDIRQLLEEAEENPDWLKIFEKALHPSLQDYLPDNVRTEMEQQLNREDTGQRE